MNLKSMTDQAVSAELGRRIEQFRLERNQTQQQIADEIGLSRISYRKLEAGEGKLVNFIAVLRVFGLLDSLDKLLPETIFSPIEQLKMKGKVRKRASRRSGARTKTDEQGSPENELDW